MSDSTELSRQLAETRMMLHRAIQELATIHWVNDESEAHKPEHRDLFASCEGKEIVEQGMALLGLKDLSDDSIVGRRFIEQKEGDHA